MKKTKVLLVEDEKFYRQSFMRLVKQQELPYDCVEACSIEQARQALDSKRFDIVLSDYSLGDGTALDLLEIVKEAPVIVITGAGDEEVAISAYRAGAYDYLVKDIDQNYLKAIPMTIEKSIRHKKAMDQIQLLSAAVMSASDSIIITDTEDRIVFVNHAFCETYGYDEDEIIGADSMLLSGEVPLSCAEESVFMPVAGSELMTYHVRKDGRKFPVSLSVSAITDQKSAVQAYVAVARDISERVSAEYEVQNINLKLLTGNRVFS